MPLKRFECPEGQLTDVATCLAGCHREEGRCLSLPTLHAVSWQREWTGDPSTTQLLNGTRLAYLELTCDYTIVPTGRAFALLGSEHHRKLDSIAKKLSVLSEEKLTGEVTGILDLLTLDETTTIEAYELWDYKTWGSYKVAKTLGIVAHKAPDPSGEVYQKDSKYGKKGEVKMINVYHQDPAAVDMLETELQLNNYRVKIEELGFPVSNMKVQVTVRDGGTYIAQNRGIEENMYVIPVQRLDDAFVERYFTSKRYLLLEALRTGKLPEMCNVDENWDGVRCKRYCNVWQFCDYGIEMHGKETGDEAD